MAEDKADKALREAEYTLKLIIASDKDRESHIIDISDVVRDELTEKDVFPENTAWDWGISKRLVGLWEDGRNWTSTPPLYCVEDDESIIEGINRIIDASVVNAKQASSMKDLIADLFQKRKSDKYAKMDRTFGEQWGFITFPDEKK